MNFSIYSFLPIFIIILIGPLVLRWQERKYQFEYSLFFTDEQLQQQILIPQRDILDSWLIVTIGGTLLEFGGIFLWTTISMILYGDGLSDVQTRKIIEESMPRQLIFSTILLGGGIALLVLGIRSVIMNLRYKKQTV